MIHVSLGSKEKGRCISLVTDVYSFDLFFPGFFLERLSFARRPLLSWCFWILAVGFAGRSIAKIGCCRERSDFVGALLIIV